MIWGAVAHKRQVTVAPAGSTVVVNSTPSTWFFPFWMGWMMGGGNYGGSSVNNYYSGSSAPASAINSESGTWGSDDNSSDSGSWGSDDNSSYSSDSESGSFGSDE